MRSRIRLFILLILTGAVAYALGRTRSAPVAPNLPPPFDPVAVGLEGKRAALAIDMWPLENVVAHLSQTYDVPIRVDWKGLEAEGIDTSTPVVLVGDNLNFAEALCRLDVQFRTLCWNAHTGAIHLMPSSEVADQFVARIYDLRPLYKALANGDFEEADAFQRAAFSSSIKLAIDTAFELESDAWRTTSLDDETLGGFCVIKARPYDHVRIARLLNWLADQRDVERFKSEYRAFESPQAGRW